MSMSGKRKSKTHKSLLLFRIVLILAIVLAVLYAMDSVSESSNRIVVSESDNSTVTSESGGYDNIDINPSIDEAVTGAETELLTDSASPSEPESICKEEDNAETGLSTDAELESELFTEASSERSSSEDDPEDVSEKVPEDAPEDASQSPADNNSSLSVEDRAREILDSMTLTEQIYQMFIVKPEQITGVSVQTQAGSTTQNALEKYPVGGVVFFAANIQTRSQVSTMISNMQSYSKLGLFIAVDEEGGTVARIGNNSNMGTTSFPNMKTIGDSGDTSQAYNVGYTIGSEIAQLGFNLDFAPVADVDSNPDNPVIGDRAFSSDESVAASMVAAAVQGFNDSGMLCTLKHFPGHGDTATDSHAGYTELDKSLDELLEVEFVPFQGGINAGADFVMVGHISVPQVTGDDVPASLSSTMIGILRGELGFDGLIITDSMQMEAITDRYTSGEAAVMAIQAGVDIILMPEDLQAAVSGVEAAVNAGTISRERIEESVLKILEAKIEAGIE